MCTAKTAYEAVLRSSDNKTLAVVAAINAVDDNPVNDALPPLKGTLANGTVATGNGTEMTPNGARRLLRRLLQTPGSDIGACERSCVRRAGSTHASPAEGASTPA